MPKVHKTRRRRAGRIGKTKIKNRTFSKFIPPQYHNRVVRAQWDPRKSPKENMDQLGLQTKVNANAVVPFDGSDSPPPKKKRQSGGKIVMASVDDPQKVIAVVPTTKTSDHEKGHNDNEEEDEDNNNEATNSVSNMKRKRGQTDGEGQEAATEGLADKLFGIGSTDNLSRPKYNEQGKLLPNTDVCVLPSKPHRLMFHLSVEDQKYMARCMGKHGVNYQAMARDVRFNNMQHSPQVLESMGRKFLALNASHRRCPVPPRVAQLVKQGEE